MVELTDALFNNKDKLGSDELSKYLIKRVEDVKEDLLRFQEWDGKTPVATCVLGLQEGSITRCLLHLEGESEVKRLEVAAVLGKVYKGSSSNQVRIGKVELRKLRFSRSLVSEWLAPDEVDWSVTRPSISSPGSWRDVDRDKVVEDGGLPLHFRAVAQPWTGGKLKVVLGLVPALDIMALPGYDHPRFPLIPFSTNSVTTCRDRQIISGFPCPSPPTCGTSQERRRLTSPISPWCSQPVWVSSVELLHLTSRATMIT